MTNNKQTTFRELFIITQMDLLPFNVVESTQYAEEIVSTVRPENFPSYIHTVEIGALKAAQDENYKLICEMQSYINKADEAIFNENQAHAKIQQLKATINRLTSGNKNMIEASLETQIEQLKSEIEVLKYDNEQLTTKLAYWENGEN